MAKTDAERSRSYYQRKRAKLALLEHVGDTARADIAILAAALDRTESEVFAGLINFALAKSRAGPGSFREYMRERGE